MGGLFGGPDITMAAPPDNSDMLKWMAQRDDRNNALYAERQDQIMQMENERLQLESASKLSIQKAEADILRQAQSLETAAQDEAAAQAADEVDSDIDNVVTGFYGSLIDRPE
tara:strand:- start:1420 stop:1755 length:336 start_codon:yes stop_codon:yes gene_type:complete